MNAECIRIGISACLLGERVRFDGGHKRSAFLVEWLGRFVEWVPVCPEVEVGLGKPREAMRLVRHDRTTRLLTVKTGADKTGPLVEYAMRRLDELCDIGLCGFVLKKDSPSCGLEGVTVYGSAGMPERVGRGIFASALVARFPALPVEEEGRLNDARLRENFIERVFAYHRVTTLFAGRWTTNDVVRFHTAHKLTLLAHQLETYRALGHLVADASSADQQRFEERYTSDFMATLAAIATRPRHANVLLHMLGYLKRLLDRDSRHELLDTIQQYASGLVPLIVPIALFKHHIRRFDVGYLAAQRYLQPHPAELMLRNYV